MNWQELKAYVNEPGRTRSQLERVARTIGVNPNVTGGHLLHNINRRIELRLKEEGPDAMSGFNLPNSSRGRTNGGGSQRRTNTPPRRSRSSGQSNGEPTMLNQLVKLNIDLFDPNNDYETLQSIAPHYDIDQHQNFYALKKELVSFLEKEAVGHAPREVHDIIVEWQEDKKKSSGSPPPSTNNGENNMTWFLRLAGLTAAALLILVVGLWLFNELDDDDSTPTGPDSTPTATATNVPPTNPTATATTPPAEDDDEDTSGSGNGDSGSTGNTTVQAGTYNFPTPSSNLDSMPKVKIDVAPQDTWFHRVFNEALFKAPDWGGADSWFVTLALGRHSGGNWTSHGNPGQVVYRGTSTNINWCAGFLTTSQYKDQFLAGAGDYDVAVNVRIAPNSPINVITSDGETKSGTTSDAGDITIIFPDDGVTTVCVAYTTAAPTHESLVWWGPYDRSENINTIDAR